MAAPVTLTFAEAQAWLTARTYRMHLGLVATEQALAEAKQEASYLRSQAVELRADRDRLAAEVAILRAERGARSRPHHVRPEER